MPPCANGPQTLRVPERSLALHSAAVHGDWAIRSRSIALALFVLCLLVAPAASGAAQQLSQLAHSIWRIEDGQFASPNAIAQTRDGYIWIGTDRGLMRFDGVRFANLSSLPAFPSSEFRVNSLMAARDGALWVGAAAVVARIRDGSADHYKIPALPSWMIEDQDATVWVVETRGPGGAPLCHLANAKVECFGPPKIPLKYASTVVHDSEDGLWLGGASGLCHWRPTTASADCYLQKALEPLAGLDGVSSILLSKDGSAPWVGVARSGAGFGLGRLNQEVLEPVVHGGVDSSTLPVSSILEDRRGALWVGTFGQGIYRFSDGQVDHFGAKEGLSSDDVIQGGLFEDREGVIWVLTTAGIDAFRSQIVSVFSTREGLSTDGVESVLPLSNGDVWLGNTTLSVLRNDRVIVPGRIELFGERSITSLLETNDRRLWIGVDRTLQIFDGTTLKEVSGKGGGGVGVVQALLQDGAGDIWVSTVSAPHRLLRVREERVVEELDTDQVGDPGSFAVDPVAGIWLGYKDGHIVSYRLGKWETHSPDDVSKGQIRALSVDTSGTIVAATSDGILVQQGGHRQLLDAKHGLPCASTFNVVTSKASLWVTSICGVIQIDAHEFARWRDNPESLVHAKLFDVTDGARSGYAAFTPGAKLAPDGRLWLATSKFAEVIDPSALDTQRAAIPVKVEEFIADRTTLPLRNRIKVPAATRDISIRYTALTSVAPQKTQFAYRLKGRDDDWEDVGLRREAVYTDLSPGEYTFSVRASRNDGLWSDSASIDFEIAPLFYQTRWFLALCALVLFVAAYALFWLRLRHIATRLKLQMRTKSLERERIARNLHDTLLQDTQALVLSFQTIAERFPAGETRHLMESVLDRADQILADGRDTVLDLREHDARAVDLPESLARVGEQLAQSTHCDFKTIVEGRQRDLVPAVRDEVYQICREAILNAFQHAQAGVIETQLNYGQHTFAVHVRDDGVGIDPQTLKTGQKVGHWGLIGIRERAKEIGGRVEVWSGSRPGTEIQLEVPARIAYADADARRSSRWRRWITASVRNSE